MPDCKYLDACPFFNDKMDNMPAMASMIKEKYCHMTPEACARYIVRIKLGKEKVPAILFPGDIDKAKNIIGEE